MKLHIWLVLLGCVAARAQETVHFASVSGRVTDPSGAVVPSADGSQIFLCNGDGPPGTTGKLLGSRDGGRTWQQCTLPGTLNSTPWCVAVHPADPKLVFMCTNLGQLYRSDDGGERWQRLKHEFGEVRALHWRALPADMPRGAFTITKRTVPA